MTGICGVVAIAVIIWLMVNTLNTLSLKDDRVKEADFTDKIIAKQIKPKEDIEQLLACQAALIDCLDQMERTPKSAVSPDFIAAIDDGRKALGES